MMCKMSHVIILYYIYIYIIFCFFKRGKNSLQAEYTNFSDRTLRVGLSNWALQVGLSDWAGSTASFGFSSRSPLTVGCVYL